MTLLCHTGFAALSVVLSSSGIVKIITVLNEQNELLNTQKPSCVVIGYRLLTLVTEIDK